MQKSTQQKLPRKRPELLLAAVALVIGAVFLTVLGLHGDFSSAAQATTTNNASAASENTNPFEAQLAQDAAQAATLVQSTAAVPPGSSYAVGYTGVVVVDGQQYAVNSTGAATPGTQAPQAPQAPQGPVNLNTATQAQLETLPGIGPAKAQAILAWRAVHGGFTNPRQLLEVKGIGEKTLANLLPLITV